MASVINGAETLAAGGLDANSLGDICIGRFTSNKEMRKQIGPYLNYFESSTRKAVRISPFILIYQTDGGRNVLNKSFLFT